MKKITFSIIVSGLLFTACNNSDSSADTNVAFDSSLAKSATPATVSTPVPVTDSAGVLQNTGQTSAPVLNAVVPAGNATGAGLNPAHGQPGHRCDIAVGAPLNSAPAKTTTSVSSTPATSTATIQPTVTAPATKTAPGMNPPHGQPGHRCDIAVGAPLNSAPAKPAATTEPAKTEQKAQQVAAENTPATISAPVISTENPETKK